MQRTIRILACLAVAIGLMSSGCVEEPRCETACRHTCEICGEDCSDTAIQTCTQSCQDTNSDPDRVDCIIATDSCDALWEC